MWYLSDKEGEVEGGLDAELDDELVDPIGELCGVLDDHLEVGEELRGDELDLCGAGVRVSSDSESLVGLGARSESVKKV